MAPNPDWFLFNKIFESYDKLKFQKEPCDRLVVHAHVSVGEKVLDVLVGLAGRHWQLLRGRANGTCDRDRYCGQGARNRSRKSAQGKPCKC